MQTVGIKYGLICGLVYIIVGLISIVFGQEMQSNWILGILVVLVTVVGSFFVIFYGVKEYRDTVNGGALTTGEAVKLGALIALIAAIMAALFNLLYHYVIDPEYMERMLASGRETLEERGMTDEQIESAMKWTVMSQNPLLGAAFGLVWTSLCGLIKGLISGAILKQDPTPVA
jgi:amino acid transporter